MLSLKKEFYFCFYINRLDLLDGIAEQLDPFTHFRIEILKNNRALAASQEALCAINQHTEVVINQLLSFRMAEDKDGCELRLVMIVEGGTDRVIGRFQFQLGNYIRAYQELRRNCIELSVQIAPHYLLIYDVFIERTEEALNRIIREHQTAIRFNMHGDVFSDIDSFLPHEVNNQNFEEIYREIRIDQASPLIFHQRFWSPKRSRQEIIRKFSNLSKMSDKVLETTSNSLNADSNRISLLKLNKSASSASDLEPNKVRFFNNTTANIRELDIESQAETEDQHRQFFQLYQVIRSDSKIVLPEEIQAKNGEKVLDLASQCQKKMKRSMKKYQNPIKIVILAILIITVIGFFIFLCDKPNQQIPKQKKGKKQKIKSRGRKA